MHKIERWELVMGSWRPVWKEIKPDNRGRLMTQLSGGEPCCAHCGNTDKRVLQIHHIDGRKNPSNERIVLCANCHVIIHSSGEPTQ
jgi:hypothetical protein